MLIFPQLLSGAVAQFPLSKTYSQRNVTNEQEGGTRFIAPDVSSRKMQWNLSYRALVESEATTLTKFFGQTKGKLQLFTFLDPTQNLLQWSEDLAKPVWVRSALLTVTPGSGDYFGAANAVNVVNTSGAELTLEQTLPFDSTVVCCFSTYARSDGQQSFRLVRSGSEATSPVFTVGPTWKRFHLTASSLSGELSSTFSISVPPGSGLDLCGISVGAQPAPGVYLHSLANSGVYSAARFDQDVLTFTATGPNEFSCDIRITAHLS